eukprot:gnl/TRDRNA2_/TRDRNA2_182679_c0_seq1.p1 gnl/TRDRNA2_/TRDRNA2_182679_c0~~gnl/TRDRNA2_/TRDRNA2_182679_c0_seq1.p1  ORF type:complete len:851 (+),score=272.33 gnl/TRDRNA2_/TRDRNA2_182679_c0_seq1:49-2553(+)
MTSAGVTDDAKLVSDPIINESTGKALSMMGDNLSAVYEKVASDAKAKPKAKDGAKALVAAYKAVAADDDGAALENATKAVASFREAAHSEGIADATRVLVSVHGFLGKRKDAANIAKAELDKFGAASDKVCAAKMMLSIAEVSYDKRGNKKREEAASLAKVALEVFRENSLREMEAKTLLTLVNIHVKTKGDVEQEARSAQKCALEASKIFEELKSKKGQAMASHALAAAYICEDETEMAVKQCEKAAKLFTDEKLMKLAAFEYECCGQWLLDDNNPDDALAMGTKAMECIGGWTPAILRICVTAHLKNEDTEKAIEVAKEGLEAFKSSGKELAQAAACDMLIMCQLALDDFKQAMIAAGDALDVLREQQDLRAEGKLLRKMAFMFMRVEKYNDAKRNAQSALAIFQDLNDDREKAQTLHTLADIFLASDQHGEAMQAAERERTLFKKVGDKKGEGTALLVLCDVHNSERSYEEAVNVASEAAELFREAENAKGEAIAQRMIAEVEMQNKNYSAVLKAASLARSLLRSLGEKEAEVSAMVMCAQAQVAHIVQGPPSEDKKFRESKSFNDQWEKAHRISKESVALSKRLGDQALVSSTLLTLGQVQMVNGRLKESLTTLAEAQTIAKRDGDKRTEGYALTLSADALNAQGNLEKALDAAEEGLTLFEQIKDDKGVAMAEQMLDYLQPPAPVVEMPAAGGNMTLEQMQLLMAQMQAAQRGGPQPQQQAVEAADAGGEGSARRDVAKTAALSAEAALDEELVKGKIQEVAMDLLGLDEQLEQDTPFMEAGLTSNTSVLLRDKLSSELPGINLPFTLVFDFPSIAAVADFVRSKALGN